MKIYKARDYDGLGRRAASIIASQVLMKPDCVLGLATGSTPIGAYKQLTEWYSKGDLDSPSVKGVNLNEYRGLTRDNGQSYCYFMYNNLFERISINTDCTNVPGGTQSDSDKKCSCCENVIKGLGGISLQLLGLGRDGHIGFNKPDEEFVKTTHCVDLTQSAIKANKHFSTSIDEILKQAYTIGIGTIMETKKILLVASGSDRTQILHDVLCGPITPHVPASALQSHNDVIAVADETAVAKF